MKKIIFIVDNLFKVTIVLLLYSIIFNVGCSQEVSKPQAIDNTLVKEAEKLNITEKQINNLISWSIMCANPSQTIMQIKEGYIPIKCVQSCNDKDSFRECLRNSNKIYKYFIYHGEYTSSPKIDTFFQWEVAWHLIVIFFYSTTLFVFFGIPWQLGEEKGILTFKLFFGAAMFPFAIMSMGSLILVFIAIF